MCNRKGKKIGGIITATGKRNRKNEFEPLKELGNITIIKRLVLTFQRAGIAPIVVITGEQAEEVERHLANYGVVFLRNEKYKEMQMFESSQLGFAYLEGKVDRIVFTKVDVPLFTTDTVKYLLSKEGAIVSPVYKGKTGHPLCIDASFIPDILSYKGENGMKGFLHSVQSFRIWVDVEDEGILHDVGEEKNSIALLERHNQQIFHPYVRLSLEKEKLFFDGRAKMLLLLIDDTNSVRGACKKMAMSYSKAWNLLNEMETILGFSVVKRKHGGRDGGKTYLSESGKQFLNRYIALEDTVKAFAEQQFTQLFADYHEKKDEKHSL